MDLDNYSAGLWQYAVVHFKDTFFAAAAALIYYVRILSVVNQNDVISSRDAFKAKLVNLLFGCTAFEISDLMLRLDSFGCGLQEVTSFSIQTNSNTSGGPKIFKLSFARSKFYAKATAFVVPSVAAAANMNLDLSSPPKTTTPMLPVVSELSVLIKFLVEPVDALVVLVTKLLSTLSAVNASVKKCVAGLAKQNKGLAAVASIMQKKITHLEKKCEWICLEDTSDNNDMVDNNDNDDKKFSTAKWMSDMVKNSHELVSIMDKIYELDMFDILSCKGSTNV
ncbi:hypothetical protein G9A89_003589 [Geosiphon pyriformis]|nr:hypothetical protein G9A89_003589 [Geosiphon pyriformis]